MKSLECPGVWITPNLSHLSEVAKSKAPHIFSKHYYQGIRLRAHGTARIPNPNLAESSNRWHNMFNYQFKSMHNQPTKKIPVLMTNIIRVGYGGLCEVKVKVKI